MQFFGKQVIYGAAGEHDTPYLTRFWVLWGRLRYHVFHRGDADPDPHDHPWEFWTFPLVDYVEEVTEPSPYNEGEFITYRQIVRRFKLHYRPATHCHRVLGALASIQTYSYGSGAIIHPPILHYTNDRAVRTIIICGRVSRKWGFLKNRDGKWCWIAWRDYVFGGGKHAPCEDPE